MVDGRRMRDGLGYGGFEDLQLYVNGMVWE